MHTEIIRTYYVQLHTAVGAVTYQKIFTRETKK